MDLNVTFANVLRPRKLLYSCAPGVLPSTWVMWAIPQDERIESHGDLVFTDGFDSVTLTDCQVKSQEVELGVNGPMMKIIGVDRRERWQGQAVDGIYNVVLPDGSIDPSTERTPQELATLLWTAMGEPTASIANLPDTRRPFMNWDCADASSELDSLCSALGCEPSLDVSNDTAGIDVKGTGNLLPDNQNLWWSQELESGVRPQRVEACSGHALWQSKFRLRAILRDTDGKWKLADDVSYAPAGGWDGNVSLPDPLDPDDPNWSEDTVELARDLWKVWRVETFADDSLEVNQYKAIPSIDYALPLSRELLEPYLEDNGDIGQTAYLMGTARIEHENEDPTTNSGEGTRLQVGFSLNEAEGIVRTNQPVAKLDAELAIEEAELYLVATHRVRDEDHNQYVRHIRFQTPGGPGGVLAVRRLDVQRRITAVYGTGSLHKTIESTTDTENAVNAILDDEIQIAINEAGPHEATVATWSGVQEIGVDGAIRSVIWFLDSTLRENEGNCITWATRNIEGGPILFELERRRRGQVLSGIALRDLRGIRSREHVRRGVP